MASSGHPLPSSSAATTSTTSTSYSLITTSLSHRLGPIRLLRRSVSMYAESSQTWVSGWTGQRRRRGSKGSNGSGSSGSSSGDDGGVPLGSAPAAPGKLPGRIPDSGGAAEPRAVVPYQRTAPVPDPPARSSGVNWKYGAQGVSLLESALRERNGAASSTSYKAAFERKSYIDSVTYLLDALPEDLTAAESLQLARSVPRELLWSDADGAAVALHHPRTPLPPASRRRGRRDARSMLHRLVATVVAWLIVLAHFLAPYVARLGRWAARCEARYRVGERVIGHGAEFAQVAGRASVSVSGWLCGIGGAGGGGEGGGGGGGGGGFAASATATIQWTVDGVVGGVVDGVRQGFLMTGTGGDGTKGK